MQQLLQTLDVLDGVAEDLHLGQPLVGVGARASLQGLEGLVDPLQAPPLPHRGGLPPVHGHRLPLARLARPQEAASVGPVVAGSQHVRYVLVRIVVGGQGPRVLVEAVVAVVVRDPGAHPGVPSAAAAAAPAARAVKSRRRARFAGRRGGASSLS